MSARRQPVPPPPPSPPRSIHVVVPRHLPARELSRSPLEIKGRFVRFQRPKRAAKLVKGFTRGRSPRRRGAVVSFFALLSVTATRPEVVQGRLRARRRRCPLGARAPPASPSCARRCASRVRRRRPDGRGRRRRPGRPGRRQGSRRRRDQPPLSRAPFPCPGAAAAAARRPCARAALRARSAPPRRRPTTAPPPPAADRRASAA